jgi:hypothetical protein
MPTNLAMARLVQKDKQSTFELIVVLLACDRSRKTTAAMIGTLETAAPIVGSMKNSVTNKVFAPATSPEFDRAR